MRVLILGGSSQASLLARRLAQRGGFDAVLSLAGRTHSPMQFPVPLRIGGFGGPEGLARHLVEQRIEALVDATHPFAAQITRNAAAASLRANVPLLGFSRPPWRREEGDRWRRVADMAGAAAALGETPRTIFLTIGRLSLGAFAAAPQHFYLVRTIDPLDDERVLPRMKHIRARPPFEAGQEEELMRREGVEALVTKNSGGAASVGKLVAARALGLEVVMVERPPEPQIAMVYEVEAALEWLEARRAARAF